MNLPETITAESAARDDLFCDLLILSDGTILAHNLTPVMADALQAINPTDATLRQRAAHSSDCPPAGAVVDPLSAP
jgi:hypothetical protein